MNDESEVDLTDPNETFTCWCGATGTYDELFDDDLEESCGGSGVLHCFCGGDLCVCHHHGEAECHGCEDCETDDDSCYDDDQEDEKP